MQASRPTEGEIFTKRACRQPPCMHGMGGGSLRTCTSLPDLGQQPTAREQCWLKIQIGGTVAVAQPEVAIVVRGF